MMPHTAAASGVLPLPAYQFMHLTCSAGLLVSANNTTLHTHLPYRYRRFAFCTLPADCSHWFGRDCCLPFPAFYGAQTPATAVKAGTMAAAATHYSTWPGLPVAPAVLRCGLLFLPATACPTPLLHCCSYHHHHYFPATVFWSPLFYLPTGTPPPPTCHRLPAHHLGTAGFPACLAAVRTRACLPACAPFPTVPRFCTPDSFYSDSRLGHPPPHFIVSGCYSAGAFFYHLPHTPYVFYYYCLFYRIYGNTCYLFIITIPSYTCRSLHVPYLPGSLYSLPSYTDFLTCLHSHLVPTTTFLYHHHTCSFLLHCHTTACHYYLPPHFPLPFIVTATTYLPYSTPAPAHLYAYHHFLLPLPDFVFYSCLFPNSTPTFYYVPTCTFF